MAQCLSVAFAAWITFCARCVGPCNTIFIAAVDIRKVIASQLTASLITLFQLFSGICEVRVSECVRSHSGVSTSLRPSIAAFQCRWPNHSGPDARMMPELSRCDHIYFLQHRGSLSSNLQITNYKLQHERAARLYAVTRLIFVITTEPPHRLILSTKVFI